MKTNENSRLLVIETAEQDIILKLESLEETNNLIRESINTGNKEIDKIRKLLKNI